MISARSLRGALAVLATTASLAAAAALEECPVIRPPGLAPADIDQIVLAQLASGLGLEPAKIDRSKTVRALLKGREMPGDFNEFLAKVGEELGFDGPAAFHGRVREKKGRSPYESLSIADYQAASRAAYASGKDAALPTPREGAEYPLYRIRVRTPSPAAGWLLMRCMTNQVVFQRIEPGVGGSTAMAVTFDAPKYTTEREFLDYTRQQVSEVLHLQGPLSFDVTPVKGSKTPCSQVRADLVTAGQPHRVRGRFCYSDRKGSELIYGALFGHLGGGSIDRFSREADAFIAGALPR